MGKCAGTYNRKGQERKKAKQRRADEGGFNDEEVCVYGSCYDVDSIFLFCRFCRILKQVWYLKWWYVRKDFLHG